MCGIAGICSLRGEGALEDQLRRMARLMAHRGPDGEGVHVDGAVGLAHRRLAILDLSAAGHQPMAVAGGDLVITYNGEVYNYRELRGRLEALGHRFESRTDTEVILRAYEAWGDACVDEFSGMFAFAIWDRRRRRLFLARDRFGVKPLYWHFENGRFLFASEVKAILEHPDVRRAVCMPALDQYFTFQNVLTDHTLFEGVRLLPPGHLLTLEVAEGARPVQRRYWDYVFGPPLDLTEAECAERVHEVFTKAVGRQLVSDVPVGAYLSGGVDSGSIAAVAGRHLKRLTTFTGGFDMTSVSGLELGFDERQSAEILSNHIKSEHYEVVLHAGDMEWVLPELVWHLEDLRVGQSYPNYYVARLAGKFVKVVLSGCGGDEVFGGYPWRYYRGQGGDGREAYLRHYYDFWQRLVPDEDKVRLFNADTVAQVRDHSAFDVFRGVYEGWKGGFETKADYVDASLYFELKTFLHGLLVVEDKLSMAHSLETRVPFLDEALVDLACHVPARYKLKHLDQGPRVDENLTAKRKLHDRQTSEGKAILRMAMARVIPPETVDRAKQGFSAPDATWFRGPSIDYINALLRDPAARIYSYLRPDYVAGILDLHCSGRANKRLLIWSFLNFEWWCRCFLDGETPEREMTSYHESRGPRPEQRFS